MLQNNNIKIFQNIQKILAITLIFFKKTRIIALQTNYQLFILFFLF